MARVLRSALANADLIDLWNYIAKDSLAAADRLLRKLDRTTALLGSNPGIGEHCDEIRTGLRRFVVRKFVVYYELIPDGIRVVRILHGSQRHEDLH